MFRKKVRFMIVTIEFIDDESIIFECEESVHCKNGLEKFHIRTGKNVKIIAYPVHRIKSITYESE